MNKPLSDGDLTPARHIALLAEEELNESRLAVLMTDASIDQIMALDTAFHVRAWNKACEDVTGISRADAIGKAFNQVRDCADKLPQLDEAMRMALKGFKSFVPWEKGSHNGYFEHHFIPLKSGEEVIGVLVIIHDVAHRIKAENQLQKLNRALAHKNRELQQKSEEIANFNRIASHDLKEPLRKIYTFIEMVATKEGIKLTDAARTNLRRAQSAVQRMGLLTDDIVSFSQVAAPVSYKTESVDLQQVLAMALEQHKKTIENDGSIIEADPLPVIEAYPDLVRSLFSHMLANGLKFHKEGAQPRIAIRYSYVTGAGTQHEEAESDAAYHCISFEDNGIGFAPEYTEKIFGMFQRLHLPGTYKGTGMGLPICRKVVEAHEGFITVKSEEGSGSTFSCYLKDLREAE